MTSLFFLDPRNLEFLWEDDILNYYLVLPISSLISEWKKSFGKKKAVDNCSTLVFVSSTDLG